jgi:hypothetical protein
MTGMTRRIRERFLLIALVLSSVHLFGLDLRTSAGLMIFDGALSTGEDSVRRASIEYNWMGSLEVEHFQGFKQNPELKAGFLFRFEQDPILYQRILGRVGFHSPFFSVSGGPFLGMSRKGFILPGLSLVLEGRIPDRLSGSLRIETSIPGAGTTDPANYTQNEVEVSGGWLFPFGTLGITLGVINYNEESAPSPWTAIEKTRFSLSLETGKFLSLYRACLDLGYQRLGWAIHEAAGVVAYQHHEVFAGLQMIMQVFPRYRIILGAELPLHIWVAENMQETLPTYTVLYEFTLGMSWNLDRAN